jgi:hypothetical protein
MEMGTQVFKVDVIEESTIREYTGDLIDVFYSVLDKHDLDISIFIYDYVNGIYVDQEAEGEAWKEAQKAYKEVTSMFKKETEAFINIASHTLEDRYDEVDGVYWYVENKYVLKPEISEEMHNKIETNDKG